MADGSNEYQTWQRAARRRTRVILACVIGSWAVVGLIWMALRRILALG